MSEYKRKIHELLACMEHLHRTSVRFANHGKVSRYLEVARSVVTDVTGSFQETDEHVSALSRFRAHIEQEEKRLKEGLETAKYELDASDMLALINRRRGLEKVQLVCQWSM